jgi:hypothetical protein
LFAVAALASSAASSAVANRPPSPIKQFWGGECAITSDHAVWTWGRIFALGAQCGVPASATAVVANLTVTQPTAAGLLSVLPGDAPAGNTIDLAFGAGQTRANNAILSLSVDGQESIAVRNTSAGTVHLILDVSGYFAP